MLGGGRGGRGSKLDIVPRENHGGSEREWKHQLTSGIDGKGGRGYPDQRMASLFPCFPVDFLPELGSRQTRGS